MLWVYEYYIPSLERSSNKYFMATTTKKKTTKKKSSTPAKEKSSRPRNSGMFQKGNTIGSATRFGLLNDASDKYDESYCEIAIAHAMSDDIIYPTRLTLALEIGVSPNTITTWGHTHPRFGEALRIMDEIREQKLAEGGATRAFDPSVVKFILSSKHGYTEKTKTEAEVKQEITVTINGIE